MIESLNWLLQSSALSTFVYGYYQVELAITLKVAHTLCRYEETPEGGLKPQAPEGVIFTGEKSNTIGPGHYNPSPTAVKAEPKAANFGRGGEIDRTAFLLGNTAAPGKWPNYHMKL